MADNTRLNANTTDGDDIATDDIGGIKHQRVKVQHGEDGSATDVSAASPLPVEINNNNLVSTDNSSSTPLTGGATFTGTGEDVSDYCGISVQVFASHVSADDGLSMEFSTDGSNWDEKHIATVAAITSREFTFPAHAKYFRVVYTNNSTAQTAFRLQTILHVQTLNGTSHALSGSSHADDVGILTKAVTIAQAAGTGDFIPVQATAAGNLKVSIEEADTSASGLAKAEDAVHSSGDVGVMALGVRTDAPASTAADGDYAPFQFSEEGALWTENLPSEVEAGNSSTSTLGIGAIFTGTGVDLLDHQAITVMIDASHDSATDGMQFQFSSDNSNWDVSLDFTYTVNGGRIFQFGIYARYFRIVYTNGGTGQTHFRCQTLLHHETTLMTIHRLVDNASPDRSAEIVKSAIIAQAAGAGDFVPVQATAAGNLKMAIEEFDTDLPTGANLIGDVGISGARTSGGTTLYKNIDVDESEDEIKGTAGQIYWMHVMNLSASVLFLKIYDDTAANVIVGTTVPDLTFPIPTQGDTNGAGFTLPIPNGIAFGTAITIACTTGIADADDGAPGANACVVNLGYG